LGSKFGRQFEPCDGAFHFLDLEAPLVEGYGVWHFLLGEWQVLISLVSVTLKGVVKGAIVVFGSNNSE